MAGILLATASDGSALPGAASVPVAAWGEADVVLLVRR